MREATAPQHVTDDMALDEEFKVMKRDPYGLFCLGHDGVLRSFDAARNIVDARGLTQPQVQVRKHHDVPEDQIPPTFLRADGHNVSEWDKWHPAQRDIPKIPTEEERARNRAIREVFWRLNPDFQVSEARD